MPHRSPIYILHVRLCVAISCIVMAPYNASWRERIPWGLDVMWNFSSIGKSMSIVFAHSWFDLYSTVVITLCTCHLHAETYRSVHLGRQKYEKVKVELKFRFFFPHSAACCFKENFGSTQNYSMRRLGGPQHYTQITN